MACGHSDPDAVTLSSTQHVDLQHRLDGDVSLDPATRAMYATDASVFQIMPAAVVRPCHAEDVAAALEFCREHGLSITARGGGTSQAGQAIGHGLQLDFSKHLNEILEIQPDRRRVRVQPGIVLDELNAVLKPYDLTLPLDLSTSSRATIGGMISNNSSGTRSIIYGKTIDYVESLTVMLSDGSVVTLDDSEPAGAGDDSLSSRCRETIVRLARDHADEIARRYPRILRRVGGYNLDEFIPDPRRPTNLSKIIVGSEGTLALVLEATLRLVPIPSERALLSIQFDDLLDALAAVPMILEHAPSAIELVDRMILSHTVGKAEFEPLRWFIDGDPAGVLLAEVQGESADDLSERLDRIQQQLAGNETVTHFHRMTDPVEQGQVWKLRKAALGLSMARPGDEKAVSFVEDTAVSPDRLRDYIARFREILDRHETRAGFYAHASVGLLHIRPVIDLKTDIGVSRFESIANEVADLVLEFGGALSGEHGDGLVRAPFQERMFGPVLYEAFREIKRTFDPDGLLNPGKIVDAPELTSDLRFGPGHVTPTPETAFDFSDFGGIARAAEQCSGVGACRKSLVGTMCPSYMATRNEADSTRGRANALRMAINGQLGPEGLSHPSLKPSLDLCLECKACKSECPTGVDMARMKSEYLYQYHRDNPRPRHDHRFAGIRQTLERASNWPRLFNAASRTRLGRWLGGIAIERQPPQVAHRSLLAECRSLELANPLVADVTFFPDTFSIHCEPHHVLAAIRVARSQGLSAGITSPVCCGRPLISRGFLDEARLQAESLVESLSPLARANRPIVFLEPGCWSAVIDDLPHLVSAPIREKAAEVAQACQTFEQWAAGVLPPPSRQPRGTNEDAVLHHGHCHQKALIGTGPALEAIRRGGGLAQDLDSGCCGMAGSFGYEPDHLGVSLAIGERVLAPAVRDHHGTVVAPGFSCRHQIEHLTGARAMSTAEWLARRLDDQGC
ncbi:MAG TPA: FAD-binding oxidoreductase [Planctomycetaceae bacterium]|nr:FAD-binding oxidoreductase [Planctomycetaceae bacterium]